MAETKALCRVRRARSAIRTAFSKQQQPPDLAGGCICLRITCGDQPPIRSEAEVVKLDSRGHEQAPAEIIIIARQERNLGERRHWRSHIGNQRWLLVEQVRYADE